MRLLAFQHNLPQHPCRQSHRSTTIPRKAKCLNHPRPQYNLLFDVKALELLRAATIPGQPRPLVTIRSDDNLVLSLPWELLHHDGRFLVRDGVLDLVRSITRDVGPRAFLQPPAGKFKLVVNVSAPEGSGLNYEAESYRLTRASPTTAS